MNDRAVFRMAPASSTVPIAAVERDTGLSKDTLRVWERRYGFPRPLRDAFGERIYPFEQLERLRLIKRLLDQGHRPGKVVPLPRAELEGLAVAASSAARSGEADEATEDLAACMHCLQQHRLDELRRLLSQCLMRLGLARFIAELAAPLTVAVGEAWARGQLQIFEEHLYTEAMQATLRAAVATLPQQRSAPRVLLTTFPQEPHGLGVLMAEAMFVLDGASCVSLGTQTPLEEIASAASAQHIDIVALSFTPIVNPNHVVDGLAGLRARLPATTEIWAGGGAPVLRRRAPRQVRVLTSLLQIAPALAEWRVRAAG
jgi:DNA-binding transcriptional MerR regulator/methylmalonyl-CoA mutase cobalamin-binding subunit